MVIERKWKKWIFFYIPMAVFILLLVEGLAWAWTKGILTWK